jgi:hypothetical protein
LLDRHDQLQATGRVQMLEKLENHRVNRGSISRASIVRSAETVPDWLITQLRPLSWPYRGFLRRDAIKDIFIMYLFVNAWSMAMTAMLSHLAAAGWELSNAI